MKLKLKLIAEMSSTTLRVKLLWLIAGRAAVVTLLLGSAILIQLKSPGALPIDPFLLPDRGDLRADGDLQPGAEVHASATAGSSTCSWRATR